MKSQETPSGVDYYGVARRSWRVSSSIKVGAQPLPSPPLRPESYSESLVHVRSPYPIPAFINRGEGGLLLAMIELFAHSNISPGAQELVRQRNRVGLTPLPPPPIEELRTRLREEPLFLPPSSQFKRSATGSSPPGVSLKPVPPPPAPPGRRGDARKRDTSDDEG